MLVKCNFPDHYAGHVQLQAAERRPVCRKRMMKDQPSAVAFVKKLTSPFGRKAAQLENSNFTFSIIYRNFVLNNGHEKIIIPCFCSAFLRDTKSPGAASCGALYFS